MEFKKESVLQEFISLNEIKQLNYTILIILSYLNDFKSFGKKNRV